MVDIERLVPSGLIEQWAQHLRLQRSRAMDLIWLIDHGFTIHDGREGTPIADATARYRAEQQEMVDQVNRLIEQYDALNLPGAKRV
jgi:hypothetical protein